MDPSAPNLSSASPSPARPRVHGIVTALVTPLTPAGRIDEPGLDRLLDRQLAAGIHGIFVLGSVGEGPSLPPEMADLVARRTVSAVGGACPVLGGASDNSTELCLRRLDLLARAGVEYGVVTLPFYGWPERIEESVAYFRDLAARSPLPIMAYDLPKAVGWRLPQNLIEALFTLPNLAGLKSTHGDADAMIAACRSPLRPAGFAFLPGNTALAVPLLQAGADGLVCTPSNVWPEPFVVLYQAYRENNLELVHHLANGVVPPLLKILGVLPNGAAGIKAALEIQGVAGRHTCPPWPQASEADVAVIRGLLAAAAKAWSLTPAS